MEQKDALHVYRIRKVRNNRPRNQLLTYHAEYALNYRQAVIQGAKESLLYYDTYEVLIYAQALTSKFKYFKRRDLPTRPAGSHHLNYLLNHNFIERVRGSQGLYTTTFHGNYIVRNFSNILGQLIMNKIKT